MSGRPKAYSYIRMSTTKQRDGDSFRRQSAPLQAFCETHDLDLDTEFKLQDIGVSAFTGENLATGALGAFIEAVKNGRISSGSWLIIESYDRFSRLTPWEALPHFLAIRNAGITIAVLSEDEIFRPDDKNDMKLLYALMGLKRAHDDSAQKADRVRKSRSDRRNNLDKKNMTSMAPFWLLENRDKKGFQPIQERVAVVKLMFDLAMTLGDHAVTTELNRRGIKNFGPGKQGWQKSSVSKILTNRAVLGEYQPHTKVKGKRVPIGKVAMGYYPAVIDADLFHAVQHARQARKTAGGGRLGRTLANLFSKIMRCGHCGASMVITNKGTSGGGSYYVCSNAKRGLGCEKVTWAHRSLETSILTFVREIGATAITPDFAHQDELAEKRRQIAAEKGFLLEAERRRARAYELLHDEAPTAFRRDQFEAADLRVSQVKAAIDELERVEARLQSENRSFDTASRGIVSLLREAESRGESDVFTFRSRLRAAIGAVIKRIDVFPAGPALTPYQIRDLRRQALALAQKAHGTMPLSEAKDLIRVGPLGNLPDPAHRRFTVVFQNGHERSVKPSLKDPSRLDRIQDSNSYIVTHEQILETAPRLGLNAQTPAGYAETLQELREKSRRG